MNNLSLRFILTAALFLCVVCDIYARYFDVNINGINYKIHYTIYNPGLINGGPGMNAYGESYAVVDSAVVGENSGFNGSADIAPFVSGTVTVSLLEFYYKGPNQGASSDFCTYTWELSAPVVAIGAHDGGGGFSGPDLTGVNIPNTIKYIYSSAFNNCTNLTSVTIPNSVTMLDNAFGNCTNLTNVTINGNSLKVIGNSAFYLCSSLTSINLPYSLKIIGDHAFHFCSSLTSINIPNSVESIRASAFNNCSSLTSIDIPNSVTSIGDHAFNRCTNLRSVTLGNSIVEIGNNAFEGCNSINRVYINDLAAFCVINFKAFDSNPLSIAHRLFLNNNEITDLTIPSDVDSISDFVFYGFSSMKSLSIPKSVTSIGNYAFCNCTGLTNAAIGDTISNVGEPMSIGIFAFSNCSALTNLSIGNSVNNIGSYAFSYCTSLTNLVLPNAVTKIGDYAFNHCNNLMNISIPKSITSIGYNAFDNCNNLNRVDITDLGAWCRINFDSPMANPCAKARKLYINGEEIIDLVLPNTVTKIGNYTFYNCNGMKSAMIPNSVIDIGSYAFYLCSGMNNLTLGKSVAYIRQKAFSGCSALTNIYSKSEIAPSMDNTNCFNNNTYNNAIVYVPIGAKRDYELTNYWNLFTNIVEMNMDETPPGDANGDGEVNITDISTLIDVILSGEFSSASDVNDDGEINISDINAIIDIILNQ